VKKVIFEGQSVEVASDKTLLDALLEQGYEVNYGCRAGSCHSCLLVSDDDVTNYPVLKYSQKNLSDEQKSLNYILACQCYESTQTKKIEVHKSNLPKAPRLHRIGEGLDFQRTIVTSRTYLNDNILGLSLKLPVEKSQLERSSFDYRPGQYVQLSSNVQGSTTRCYSLASHPELHDELKFHIKILPDGEFSQYLMNDLSLGDTLYIKGPLGDCVYAADSCQTLILSAIGTGLAPIFGILLDALNQNHKGNIHICLGAKAIKDFYFYDQLIDITKKYSQVKLHFVSLSEDDGLNLGFKNDISPELLNMGDIYDYVKNTFSEELKESKIYLCGAESFVKKMRRLCFMGGANMSDIKADVFLPS